MFLTRHTSLVSFLKSTLPRPTSCNQARRSRDVLAFCHCDKTPGTSNLKGGKVYFDSQFQRLQAIVAWPCYPGLCQPEHMLEEVCSPHGSWAAEREALGAAVPLKGTFPNDLTLFHMSQSPKISTSAKQPRQLRTKPVWELSFLMDSRS